MDNPYWTTDGYTHHINLESVRLLCFEIHNIFEASKPISEYIEYAEVEDESPVELKDFPLAVLHRDFAFKIVSERILQLSLMVRTYDDLMIDSNQGENYKRHKASNDDGNYIGILKGADKFYLREACNKVIHAAEVSLVYERIDRLVCDALRQGIIGQDIWYLTGEIELSGQFRGQPWMATIHALPFLETVLGLIEFGQPESQ